MKIRKDGVRQNVRGILREQEGSLGRKGGQKKEGMRESKWEQGKEGACMAGCFGLSDG